MSTERVTVEVDGRTLSISNLDKVLFPASGFTKGQLISYYTSIAATMLPHLASRPVTFRRFPNGIGRPSFYEKHVPAHHPSWVKTATVPSGSASDAELIEYALLSDRASLAWAANLATIEIHVPLWHVRRGVSSPAPPDFLVFDLDPGPGASIVECCAVALAVAEVFASDDTPTYPKTSGSKGIQVYAPIRTKTSWDEARSRANALARDLESAHPDLVVSNMRKQLRHNKVLVDWSQNTAAKTTVSVYSVRAQETPTVSTPVTWDEVSSCASSGSASSLRFSPDQVLERVGSMGDLMAPLLSAAEAGKARRSRNSKG